VNAQETKTERLLGRGFPCRLYTDQILWLEKMEAERAANTAQIIRLAVDYYRPVFEALGDSDEAKRNRALDRAREVMESVGPDRVLELLEKLEATSIAAAGERASAKEGEAA
jgi:hypothetical protein